LPPNCLRCCKAGLFNTGTKRHDSQADAGCRDAGVATASVLGCLAVKETSSKLLGLVCGLVAFGLTIYAWVMSCQVVYAGHWIRSWSCADSERLFLLDEVGHVVGVARGDDLEAHVSAGDGPLVVLFGEDGADEPEDGLSVGKDADDVCASSDR